MAEAAIRNHAALIWSVADLLRGDYKQSEYGKVILPLVVIRRLDCVLEPTKAAVLKREADLKGRIENLEVVLKTVSGQQFFNTSKLDFRRLLEDPVNIGDNLRAYIAGFSEAARDVIAKFDFQTQITKMERANLLYLVLGNFADVDLHPNVVSNLEMGYLYEELVRRFSELSNETAGEHFTPREVIRLMVNLLFIEDSDLLTKPGIVKTLYDPACGTGGMLSVAEDHLRKLNPQARLEVFGQELNDETYAICRSDMMLKGQDASRIYSGNSFDNDGVPDQHFDYMLANPPFGVEWKKVEDAVKKEAETKGFAGRFGAGLPRINDGSFLFLQHMLSKMKPADEGGARLSIVFNGSPLFSGGASSGESEIRRWIIENDWLEAVVALPDQLFYNTGISTYFWVLTNRKSRQRQGQVQLVDAREMHTKMRKSLGNKRNEISDAQIEEVTRLYGDFAQAERVKILPNEAFGYMRITLERPLRLRSKDSLAKGVTPAQFNALLKTAERDETTAPVTDRKGSPYADPELRDQENVPLPPEPVSYTQDATERLGGLEYVTAVNDYVKTEVLPWVPDAWVDHAKTRIGYEIPVTRQFYRHVQPRALAEIDAEITDVENQIRDSITSITE